MCLLGGIEDGSLELKSGLTQGCPASCMLYVIAVDPLLAALKRMDRLCAVSGFVDDWSMGCKSISVLSAVSALVSDFERGSGQRINREKSAIIPARVLSGFERMLCFAAWGSEMRISYKERLLGIYVGVHARIDDQYGDAIDKFCKALVLFDMARRNMSLAMRILVVNIFLFSLFSYQNRILFMPSGILSSIEGKVLLF